MSNDNGDLKIHLKVKFLYPGILLKGDVYTEDGNRVIEGYRPITSEIIHDLKSRNIESIYYTRNTFGGKTSGASMQPVKTILDNSVSLVQEMENSIRSKTPLPVEQIQKTVNDITENIATEEGTILNLMDLKEYDDYTYTHSINVCLISILIAKKLNLEPDFVKKVGIAGLLHDQGKLMIPSEIINKPSKLTDSEFEIVKRHPVYSLEIIRSTGAFSKMIQQGVLYHHEKYNGMGYPTSMKGEAIGEIAQMVSLADVFDAITSARQYKTAKPFWYALSQINKGLGTAFSPRLGRLFIREIPAFLTSEPIFRKGEKVRLNTGEMAVVKDYEYPQSFYPVIDIFQTGNGTLLRHPIEVNLEFDGSRFIEDIPE